MKKGIILERKQNGECLISSSEFLHMLTTNEHRLGYNHLTNWSSLCKMVNPVVVPDDSIPHRMLHLGAADNMNDINDKRCGKRVFFTSFSFGPTENISMWTNYGIPNEEAIKIRFPRKVIIQWIKDFKENKIRIYGIDSKGLLKLLDNKVEVRLVDVAYWSKKNLGKNKNDPNEGLFFYDTDRYRLVDCDDVSRLMEEHPYLFKEFGWNYEKETRLVLVFDDEIANQYKRVAVPFDKPFEMIIKDFSNYVMHGPWHNLETMPQSKAAGHSLSEASPSFYNGLVKMRSVCDSCPKQNKATCNCPYRGQR